MKRAVVVLMFVMACGKQRSLKDQVVSKCGNPPSMSGLAMKQGLPWDGGSDELVTVDPRDYDAMLKWRDCIGSN
jgi:threonine dehydrogenase-like Zn-dependent dehydrogenase